jgi:poly-beta-1,6-N-acetyl-D-glucosamine synthase
MNSSSYAIITSAYNEERFIDLTLKSVAAQTILPVRWVIVSDGSTDRTDEIVEKYSARHQFIKLLRQESDEPRGVKRKITALRMAYEELRGIQYAFVANLDGDVSFDPSYFESLLEQFHLDSSLGISGGLIQERFNGEFKDRTSNNLRSVAHAAQMVRRTCYEDIGGYMPMSYGGEDWCAEINAKMRGWTVRACADLKVKHHRQTGTADKAFRHHFREGMMDFSMGSLPAFEVLKCVRRIPERPMVFGATTRLAGFLWSYVCNKPRLVSTEVAAFLRDEQRQRLKFMSNLRKAGSGSEQRDSQKI